MNKDIVANSTHKYMWKAISYACGYLNSMFIKKKKKVKLKCQNISVPSMQLFMRAK